MIKHLNRMAMELTMDDIKAVPLEDGYVKSEIHNELTGERLVAGAVAAVNPDGDPDNENDRMQAARLVVAEIASDCAGRLTATHLTTDEVRDRLHDRELASFAEGADDLEVNCAIAQGAFNYSLTDWGYEDLDGFASGVMDELAEVVRDMGH